MDTPTSKLSTPVKYRSDRFKPPVKAILEWTSKDLVRLSVIRSDGKDEVIVEEPVQHVQDFKIFQNVVSMKLNTVTYTMEAMSSTPSSLKDWVQLLQEKGVTVHRLGFGTVVAFALLISAGILLFAVIADALTK